MNVCLGGTAAFSDPFARSTTNPGDIVLGIYAGLYAYNGWDVLNYGTEEIRNPKRWQLLVVFKMMEREKSCQKMEFGVALI